MSKSTTTTSAKIAPVVGPEDIVFTTRTGQQMKAKSSSSTKIKRASDRLKKSLGSSETPIPSAAPPTKRRRSHRKAHAGTYMKKREIRQNRRVAASEEWEDIVGDE